MNVCAITFKTLILCRKDLYGKLFPPLQRFIPISYSSEAQGNHPPSTVQSELIKQQQRLIRRIRSRKYKNSGLFGENTKNKKKQNDNNDDYDHDHDDYDDDEEEESKEVNKKKKVGFLPLPEGYNKLVIPLGNVSKEIFVMVHLSIREILDVDSNNGVNSII